MKSEHVCDQQTIRHIGSVGKGFVAAVGRSVKQPAKRTITAISSEPVRTEKAFSSHWMIVDDNEERLSLIRAITMHFSGTMDLLCFNTPHDALAAFEAEPEKYEFILTDLEIPGLTDFALCRLRAYSPLLKILFSLLGEIFSDEEAVQKGFCQVPRKFFPLARLQPAMAPATLKYSGEFSGLDCGLRLVCANVGYRS